MVFMQIFQLSSHPTSTLLKGTEASTAPCWHVENPIIVESEATGPLGLLTVNGIAKDTHLEHRVESKGTIDVSKIYEKTCYENCKIYNITPGNQLYFSHKWHL